MALLERQTAQPASTPLAQGWLLALAIGATVLLWGAAFVGIRAALPAYGPQHLAVLRFLVASAALGVYALITCMPLPRLADLPRLALCGLLGITAYNLALNTGELTVEAGSASLLVNTGPIWTALLSMALLAERLRGWGWAGIAVSFSGAALIALGESAALGLSLGAGLILIAAVVLSAYSVLQKPLLTRYRPVQVTTYAIWFGTLGLLPMSHGLPATVAAAPIEATLAVVFLGLGPAAVAYVAWSFVLSRLPASRAAGFLYLAPACAMLIAWLWLGETPALLSLIGGTLALGGVMILAALGRRGN
jgi:drug/metabolite transporter (DMT)-like permease